MTTQSGSAPAKDAGSTRRRGKAKLIALLAVALVVLVAAQTGLLGFGLAHLRAATFPRDESLLEYVPASAGGAVILDPHQIELKALGAEGGAARTYVERTRTEIKNATGIDLGFDVDKLVLTPSLVVARGRFSHARLAERLAEHGYVEAEHKGTKYLARAGEDAIAVIDGSILLYGEASDLRAGLDAESGGASLGEKEEVTSRLSEVGWDHPILGTVQLTESKPSLRAILTGATGPRAVTIGVSMKAGLSLSAAVESASPAAAEELRKLLEEKRADAGALKGFAGPEVGPILADIAKRARIAAKPDSSQLVVQVDVDAAELEKLVKASEHATAPLGAMYKNIRLLQLLMPGL